MSATHGMIAQFDNPAELLRAAEKVRTAGYSEFDCHSPFPIHGMDQAMGLKRSPIGIIVAVMAMIGATVGMSLQAWVSTVAYPLVISGKPLLSWQAYIIITFALFVLFGAFGAVFGMLAVNKLPRLHHPLFFSEGFSRASDDGFIVSIEAGDGKFDEEATRSFLESIGGKDIETVRG